MALFKAKSQQQEPPQFDAQAFEQRMINQMQTMLQPFMTGLQSLSQRVESMQQGGRQETEEEEEGQQQPKGITREDVLRIAGELFQQKAPGVQQNYVPKNRYQAVNSFRRGLTERGKELFEKYQDEVEKVLDGAAQLQEISPENMAKAYEQSFEYVMVTNHKDEYVKAMIEELKPEDLPPHLQTPGGQGGTKVEDEPQLSEEEKEIQPVFNRTYKGGFTSKQMRDYGDLNKNFNQTMEQMIAQAKEKGLISNGTTSADATDKGNNAELQSITQSK